MSVRESLGTKGIWNAIFVYAFVINLLVHLCTFMMNTLSAKFADYLGAPATIVGLVTGLFALTALIFKIISAPAIDTFNRKNILVGAIFILFLSFVGYAFSNNVPMLIFSRLLTGAGLAFLTTGCLTVAADSLPIEKMSTGIGYFSIGTAVCQAIAPTVGLLLVGALGFTYTFAVLAVFMFLTMIFAATMKVSHTTTKKFQISLNSVIAREAIIPTVILFFLSMAFSNINAFLVLFGNLVLFGDKQAASADIGLFFTIYAVTMIFTRPLIGKLADTYGTFKVAVPAMLCFAASFLLISLSRSLPMFLLAGFISAFGYGGVQPTILAVCMKSVPKERRGAASCTSYVGMDLGNLAGPLLAGSVIVQLGDSVAGYAAMWQVMIIPILIALLVTFWFSKPITNAGKQFLTPTPRTVEE